MPFKDRDKEKEYRKEYGRKYYLKNKDAILKKQKKRHESTDYSKQYYEKNKERIMVRDAEYYQKNKEKIILEKREYRKNNKHISQAYYLKNREKMLAYNRNWKGRVRKARTRRDDIKYNLKKRISRQIRHYVKKGSKWGRGWQELLGYTTDELKTSLNETLPDGYTWDDFLDGKLHIDHIIPVSVHNFEKPEDDDFKKCWDLSNLQLLPARENIVKSNKLETHFQPSLVF